MVLLGFTWFLSALGTANSPLLYTVSLVLGGLWGGVFLHLGMSFPTGRLRDSLDRAIVIAGYVIFPLRVRARRCSSPARRSSTAPAARRTCS